MAPIRHLVVAASILGLIAVALQAQDRVRYDSQCLTIDGRDTLIFSGSFLYTRCPKELWRERFRKIKEAGFNTVDTYVPWNWHEQNSPADPADFSQVDLTDLKHWLRMAHQ